MKVRSVCVGVLLVAVLAGAGLSAGCGSKGGKGGTLEGIDWVLKSYVSGGAMQDVPASVNVDARFEGGRVGGSSGVNTYGATYTLSGSKLTIGDALSTMMAGPPLAMKVEQDYLAALPLSSSFTAEADSLTIFDQDGKQLLVYARGQSPSLTGVTWEATGYNNGKSAVVGILDGTTITATFGEDGSLTGSGGVNNYNSTYTTSGKSITITQPLATLMAGTTEAMEQEAAYLAALPTAATWSIQGSELALRREDGALVASYQAKK
jgi:heat shock protein HslJ